MFEPTVEKINLWLFQKNHYRQDFSNYKIIDLESDGKFEFLGFGGFDGIAVFDNNGRAVLRFGKQNIKTSDVFDDKKWEEEKRKNPDIRAATAADIDGDGVAEIVFTRDSDEILAIDRDGNEKWRQKSEVPGDELWAFDLNNDKKTEIIEIFFSKPILRDFLGNPIKQIEISYHACDDVLFSDENQLQFIGTDENKLFIFDENNKEVLKTDAPLSEISLGAFKTEASPIKGSDGTVAMPISQDNTAQTHTLRAVRVKLKKDSPKFLAVVAPFILLDRALFYVYDESGKLLYHEILPEAAETIAVLPNQNGVDEILVGGKQTIWRYNAK